jgi:hypothetical protein
MCKTRHSTNPPTLSTFVVPGARLVFFSAISLLPRHGGRGVHENSAIFGGTKSAVFVPPFEKDLLTRLHLELDFSHSTVHEECEKHSTSSLMDSCDVQKGGTKATVQWIGEARKIRCTVCP